MASKKFWLLSLERKISRYAIHNLMLYIVIGMGAVYVLNLFLSQGLSINLQYWLMFDRQAILHGQIWRLIGFIFLPPSASLLFIFFSLYFYWMVGSALEREWGAYKFNLYYLCGMLGTMLAGLITGYATNVYINLSLFLAFAILFPDFQILIFFVLPVKVKYLALLDVLFFVYSLVFSTWPDRIALLLSVINLALFFGKPVRNRIQQAHRRAQWKRNFRR
ncbi:MAG: hypothetical protein LBT44_06020 [Clostridiales bacterium]|nr:hypothetical protein [Clostridiales bacterium]